MTTPTDTSEQQQTARTGSRLANFAEDPLGSVISASVAVIASFGMVLSGIWLIHAGMH
jgi:hypothetical protein